MRNEIIIRDDISIYDQDVSVQLFARRADRLDEWSMDELADNAADLVKENSTLQQRNAELEAKNAELERHYAKSIPPLATLLSLAVECDDSGDIGDKIRTCVVKIKAALLSGVNLKAEEG